MGLRESLQCLAVTFNYLFYLYECLNCNVRETANERFQQIGTVKIFSLVDTSPSIPGATSHSS